MIDYIFFNAELRDKFMRHAEQARVACVATEDSMGLVVSIPEDIPEDTADEIEAYYETLEREQEGMSRADGDLNRLAGIGFRLPNGESRLLPVSTEMANRLLAHFSLEEIQALFNAVADCTLHPNDGHLCHILAEQKNQ